MTRPQSKPALLLFLELFVAVSLTVNFFYLVRPQCLPKRNGSMLGAVAFSYLANDLGLTQGFLFNSWRTRLLAPALSSWGASHLIKEPIGVQSQEFHTYIEFVKSDKFQNLFGFYHSAWLFLSFLILILFRKDALLIVLGVFAGLMYNLAEPAGAFYYPWDMPALFFFTLACLLFDKGWIWPLLPVIWLGALFKETTLCCALLVLLGSHWNWTRRIAAFVTVVTAVFATNRLLMAHYGVHAQLLSLNNATDAAGLFHNTLLFKNVRLLFSLDLNHVIFANAGTLLLILLIPWRNRRDLLFKLLIGAFAAGQFLYGIINEVRIWYELLPLGWMLVSEAISGRLTGLPEPATDSSNRLWRGSYWLTLCVSLIGALGIWVVAKQNISPQEKNAKTDEAVLSEMIKAGEAGDIVMQFKLGMIYQNKLDFSTAATWFQKSAEQGYAPAQFNLAIIFSSVRREYVEAVGWLRKAAVQEYPQAQYYLGFMYWNGLGTDKDSKEAIRLFHMAAQNGDAHAQLALGRIYRASDEMNLVESYKWLKLAELQGNDSARKELQMCTDMMTADQIAAGEARVKEFQQTAKSPMSK